MHYNPASDPDLAAEVVTPDLDGRSAIVSVKWSALQTQGLQPNVVPTYIVCGSRIYEHGGMYEGVGWGTIPPGWRRFLKLR